jgi:ubiquinone/menaquinone biosynthesis C-methylase UbiE
MKGSNNFDYVATYYDRLKRLAFNNTLDEAELELYYQNFNGKRILIVGGGTAESMSKIFRSDFDCLFYVEKSQKMLKLAQARHEDKFRAVNWIHEEITNFHSPGTFDFLITPFFLDCFRFDRLQTVIGHLADMLSPEGKWLISDFSISYNPSLFNRLRIRLMIIFFRMTSGLEANELYNHLEILENHSLRISSKKYFRNGLIYSAVVEKDYL